MTVHEALESFRVSESRLIKPCSGLCKHGMTAVDVVESSVQRNFVFCYRQHVRLA
jgi:hypothetical protein